MTSTSSCAGSAAELAYVETCSPPFRQLRMLCDCFKWRWRLDAGILLVSCLDHPNSNAPELSNNIIQKRLAFDRDWSGTVAHLWAESALRSCPAGPSPMRGFGGAARAAINRMEIGQSPI